MEPALLIDEILRHIFHHLGSELATLSALARSCQAWTEPALDYLWMRLFSITPLLHLIPGIRLVSGTYVLSHPVTSQDFTRFRWYAPRVRYIIHRNKIQVHQDILKALTAESNYPIRGMLPLLRSAQTSLSTCHSLQVCFSLSNMLHQLELDFGFKRPVSHCSETCKLRYMRKVARIAPDLQRLTIRGTLPRNMMDIVSTMCNLRTLSLRSGLSLTIDALPALSKFPYLAELELHVGHLNVDHISNAFCGYDIPTLPPLNKLHIRAQAPVLELILGVMPPDSLQTLHIDVEGPTSMPIPWDSIFELIHIKATNTLQNLTIEHHIELVDVDSGGNNVDVPSTTHLGATTSAQIPFSDLRILGHLGHLQQLILDTTLPPDICDSELVGLIKCWPEIIYLDLASIPTSISVGLQARPPVTTQSLVTLAATASKLATLVLTMDIRDIDITSIPVTAPSQRALTRMTLCCPSMPESIQVAQYLRRLFPSLMEVDGLPEHEEQWNHTNAVLKVMPPIGCRIE